MGEKADHGEYDEAGEEGGADVADSDDQGVLVAVVGELVVRAEGDEAAPGRAQGEEDLHGRVAPDLGRSEPMPVGRQVEEDALVGARQQYSTYEQGDLRDRVIIFIVICAKFYEKFGIAVVLV